MTEARLDIAIEDIRSVSGFEAVILTDLRGEILSAVRGEETPAETLNGLLQVAEQVDVAADLGDVAGRRDARPDDIALEREPPQQ